MLRALKLLVRPRDSNICRSLSRFCWACFIFKISCGGRLRPRSRVINVTILLRCLYAAEVRFRSCGLIGTGGGATTGGESCVKSITSGAVLGCLVMAVRSRDNGTWSRSIGCCVSRGSVCGSRLIWGCCCCCCC